MRQKVGKNYQQLSGQTYYELPLKIGNLPNFQPDFGQSFSFPKPTAPFSEEEKEQILSKTVPGPDGRKSFMPGTTLHYPESKDRWGKNFFQAR